MAQNLGQQNVVPMLASAYPPNLQTQLLWEWHRHGLQAARAENLLGNSKN